MPHGRIPAHPRVRQLALTALLTATAILMAASPAAAGPAAATDDKSVAVPTRWWTYTGVTAQEIGEYLQEKHARLTDVELHSAAAKTFTVTMVENSGEYFVPEWWWYYDKTEAEVKLLLQANDARLIDIDPYDAGGGVVRFAVVMVRNEGDWQRTTSWDGDTTAAQIDAVLESADPWRLVDLESYSHGGVKRYAYLAVANTGADHKVWEWWLNQTPSSIKAKVDQFGGRITNLERQADGTYNFIQVKNAGGDNRYWRYYFGLSSLAYTNEVAVQYASRVLELETYTAGGVRRYDAVMIDNADAETRRITDLFAPAMTGANGLPIANFGAYVKRVGGSVRVGLQPDRHFEPASTIKAVHNLAVMRRVQADLPADHLASSLTYYDYPNGGTFAGTKDACTNPVDELPANANTTTVDWAKDQMMAVSDNRTTRAFILLYGFPAIKTTAAITAGMTDTSIDQAHPGCGWRDGKKNLTTLADLGRLYERVDTGAVLNRPYRAEFYQPMNGGKLDGQWSENPIAAIVADEAAKQGKSALADEFISRMHWRHKGGSYDIGCADAGCSSGYLYFRSVAGRISLPIKTGVSTFGERAYVFGRYIDSLNLGCAGCTAKASADQTLSSVTPELFRGAIAAALETW